jgi:hypothetical protein
MKFTINELIEIARKMYPNEMPEDLEVFLNILSEKESQKLQMQKINQEFGENYFVSALRVLGTVTK